MERMIDLKEISDGRLYTADDMVKADCQDCKGCSACSRVCPADAISGVIRSPFKIDTSKCIKCGSCIEKCKFGAISKV